MYFLQRSLSLGDVIDMRFCSVYIELKPVCLVFHKFYSQFVFLNSQKVQYINDIETL